MPGFVADFVYLSMMGVTASRMALANSWPPSESVIMVAVEVAVAGPIDATTTIVVTMKREYTKMLEEIERRSAMVRWIEGIEVQGCELVTYSLQIRHFS